MTTLTIRNTGGTDHLSYDAVGLPGFQFIQDEVEYDSRTHHSNMDVYERVQANDMMRNAVIVASFVVQHGEPRREAAAQAAAEAGAAGRPRHVAAVEAEPQRAQRQQRFDQRCIAASRGRCFRIFPTRRAAGLFARALPGPRSSRSTGHGRRYVQLLVADGRRLVDAIAPAEDVLHRHQQQVGARREQRFEQHVAHHRVVRPRG